MLLLSPRMESSQSRLREASNQGEPRASCCAPSHATARVSSWATVLAACPVRRGPPAHRCFQCFEHGRGHQALSASALYRARGGNHLQTARPWASWARAWRSPRRSIGVASRPYQCAAERAGGRAGQRNATAAAVAMQQIAELDALECVDMRLHDRSVHTTVLISHDFLCGSSLASQAAQRRDRSAAV